MMKKFGIFLVFVLGIIGFQSCEDSKTYAELKEEEREAIQRFIEVEGIKVIDEDTYTEQDSVTNLANNEFVFFDESGVYMQIIERGKGEKLQEGRHATERKGVHRHPYGSPEEGDEIAEGKTEVDHQVTEDAEFRAVDDTAAQLTLRVLQPVYHHLVTLQRLDEHAVLDGFLQRALYLTVPVTYHTGEVAHLSDIDLAHGEKDGENGNGDDGQQPVHGEEIEEGTDKHRQHAEG